MIQQIEKKQQNWKMPLRSNCIQCREALKWFILCFFPFSLLVFFVLKIDLALTFFSIYLNFYCIDWRKKQKKKVSGLTYHLFQFQTRMCCVHNAHSTFLIFIFFVFVFQSITVFSMFLLNSIYSLENQKKTIGLHTLQQIKIV